MATTRIMPLHTGKGRTVGEAISDIIDYVKNPEKTDHGRLITSYQCDSRVADAQFLLDKQTYITNLIHSSVDPKTVQYLAGHESSKITMDIYAKVKYNQPDQVVKAMDGVFAQWDAMWA